MLYVSLYGQDAAKRQTAGIKFARRSKLSIFATQGRLVSPIHVKFGTTGRYMGSLGCAKSQASQCTGMGTRPQKWHFSTFW